MARTGKRSLLMSGNHYTGFAPNFTQNTLAADRVITAGSIHVYGFVVANDDDAAVRTVSLEDADGNTYVHLVLPVNTTVVSDIPFLAANGLSVTADTNDADLTFTVFHSAIQGAA
jgi:hypothetical protein